MSLNAQFKSILLAGVVAASLGAPAAIAQDTAVASFSQFATAADASTVSVDYQPLDQLLDAFGDEKGGRQQIAYAAIDARVQGALGSYVNYLSQVPVGQISRDDQLAYWLNTRNMLIISAMASSPNRRRMSSNRGTFAEPGEMWTQKLITVEGTPLSINDIERGIILANFSDNPNIIYGLYQGSQGGASLPERAFVGASVDDTLQALGESFVNSRQGVKVRRSKAQVPAIYSWYSDAVFGGDQSALTAHLVSLADSDLGADIEGASETRERKFSYKSDELIVRQQVAATGGFGGGAGGAGGGSFGS